MNTGPGELCTSQINIPPQAFEFPPQKFFCSNPGTTGQKAVQMPHHRSFLGNQMAPPSGKLPDHCFNFSEASIMLVNLCKQIGLIDNTIENQSPMC